MKARLIGPDWRILPVVLTMWTAVFILACLLAQQPPDSRHLGALPERAALTRLLGNSRVVLGDVLIDSADRAFHRGVAHYRPKAFSDFFVRLSAAITPGEHAHLHDQSVNEIMPWLSFAVQVDPGNVAAYLMAAFCLAGEGGQPELAENVLREAWRHNPRDYRIQQEIAKLALKRGRLSVAARAFDIAGRLWLADSGADADQARLDRAEQLLYRGLLYENAGELEAAKASYRAMLELFPKRNGIAERLNELETVGRAHPAPADVWTPILLRDVSFCKHGQEAH